jgi:hypothetical protein
MVILAEIDSGVTVKGLNVGSPVHIHVPLGLRHLVKSKALEIGHRISPVVFVQLYLPCLWMFTSPDERSDIREPAACRIAEVEEVREVNEIPEWLLQTDTVREW